VFNINEEKLNNIFNTNENLYKWPFSFKELLEYNGIGLKPESLLLTWNRVPPKLLYTLNANSK